jgi:hypothetical protein
LTASSHKPNDPEIRRKLELTSLLAALDPTSRKLTSAEKYRRSLEILDFARSSLEGCLANHPAPDDETQQLLVSASSTLTVKPHPIIANETAENVLGLAEKAWQARLKICGETTAANEEPLRLILERLAR